MEVFQVQMSVAGINCSILLSAWVSSFSSSASVIEVDIVCYLSLYGSDDYEQFACWDFYRLVFLHLLMLALSCPGSAWRWIET
jgi:hypothetical protein